jgi:serine protease Do
MEENENRNESYETNRYESKTDLENQEVGTEEYEALPTETPTVEEVVDNEYSSDYPNNQSENVKRKGIAIPAAVGLMIGAALLSAIMTSLVVPYLYGSSPQDVYGNTREIPGTVSEIAKNDQSSESAKIIRVNDGDVVNPVAAVAKKLQPSVVNIKTKQTQNYMYKKIAVASSGSGVIYSSDGYILTNNHVVAGAFEIIVTIGTEELEAKLVAADEETDLAVIKVDKNGLQPAEFGQTKDINVGDLAVAIGSPFGLEHTVTSGIISAMNRTVSIPDEQTGMQVTLVNMIQTDASINPGNSGGALSDSQGRVIGINTLIASSSGSSDGVGFAIPSEIVQRVAGQLLDGGKASHPYIGITGHDVKDVFAGESKLAVNYGAQVVDVISSGPAEKAGLKQQDIIVAIDGQQVNDMNDLIAAIRMKQVGETAKITIYRGTKKKTVDLTLAEKPKQVTN